MKSRLRSTHCLLWIFLMLPVWGASAYGSDTLFPTIGEGLVNTYAGNWKVVLRNEQGEVVQDYYITMDPPLSRDVGRETPERYTASNSLGTLEDWNAICSGLNVYDRGFKMSDNQLIFYHAYGVIGHWGAESTLSFSGDEAVGEWTYRDDSGSEQWTRLRPSITRLEFGPLGDYNSKFYEKPPVSSVEYGQTVVVRGEYQERSWGPANNFPDSRPHFYIKVYGENLSGYHFLDSDDRAGIDLSFRNFKDGDTEGAAIAVWFWPGVTTGRKVLYFDDLEIPFILKVDGLVEPGPSLRFVDTRGNELSEVMEAQVFAIQAHFDDDDAALKSAYTALVKQGNQEFPIPMLATGRPRVFQSGYYRVMQPRLVGEEASWNEWRESGDDIELPESIINVLQHHFLGTWQVHLGDEYHQGSLKGYAWVTDAGERVELHLGQGDHARHFEMYDADTELVPNGNFPAYWVAYFAEYEPQSKHTLHPSVTDLWFPRNSGEIVFQLEEVDAVLLVDYLTEAREPTMLEVNFPQPLKGWLAGDWSADNGTLSVGQGGATVWTRDPPKIDQVVVLTDQRPGAFAAAYPKDFSDKSDPRTKRRLLIVGENLPLDSKVADLVGTQVDSDDPLIEYSKYYYEEEVPERALKKAYDDRKQPRPPAGKDYMIVNANLDFDVQAGQKTLSLAGVGARWDLRFSDTNARLRFTRTFASNSKASLETLRMNDAAYLAIDFDHDQHLGDTDEIELALFTGAQNPTLVGKIIAKKEDDTFKPEFRSDLIFFYDYYGEPNPDFSMNIPVREGMVFYALPVDSAISAAQVKVVIDETDYLVGEYWLSALRSVKTSGGKGDIEKPKAFAYERAEGYTKSLYMAGLLDDRNRTIDLKNGDHAAAILIRDEFVARMGSLLPFYREQAEREAAVRAFIAKARANLTGAKQDSFWKYNTKSSVYFPDGIPLWELLDVDDLMQRFSWTDRSQTEQWVFDAVQGALKERVRNMSAARSRAENASTSDLHELLGFAGYRSPEIIDSIVARLIVYEDGRWVPDTDAIRFVEGLYVPGAAIRALDAYSDIDNAYNAMALAVITGGAAGALELGGLATAAAYTSFIVNAADAVVSGGYGAYKYFEAEDKFDMARGMAPVYGNEVVREAAAGRQSGLMTAAGILFPGQAAVRELMGIPGIREIARGKKVAGSVAADPAKLDQLDDAQKADLFAYYKNVGSRRLQSATGGKPYPKLSADDMKNYRELRKVLNPNATRAPWEMTSQEREAMEALHADRALDTILEEGGTVGRPRGPDESGYFDPHGTGEFDALPPTKRDLPPTERMTPDESGYFDPHGTGEFDALPPTKRDLPPTERMTPDESGYFDPHGTGEFDALPPTKRDLPPTERMTPDESGYFDPHGTGEFDALPSTKAKPKQGEGAGAEDSVYYDPHKTGGFETEASSSPKAESTPKTEAFTPEERAAIEAERKAPSGSVDLPEEVDPMKTQPIPHDPMKTQPIPKMEDATGQFGMNPVDPNAPGIKAEPDPSIRLERERAAAEAALSQPFQGRGAKDAHHEVTGDYYRQKQAESFEEDVKYYDLENWQSRGTEAYDEGLAELRREWQARNTSAETYRSQLKAELEKDHSVMDVVEKHTGYRSASDYTDLELERLRPGRDLSDAQAVAGVLSRRYKSKAGPLQGTPEQHLSALKEAGLNRSEAKAYLMEWYNPAKNPNDVAGIDTFVDEYLDWVGLN